MRQVLPGSAEDAAILTQRLHHARDGRQQSRLQMLYRLASAPAQTRRDVAPRLGGHRHPIGHWRQRDEGGGLAAWRHRSSPAGQPLSMPPAVCAAMDQALRQPAGLSASEARRPWVQQTDQVQVNDHTRSTSVRTRFKAQRKVPRPRHTTPP